MQRQIFCYDLGSPPSYTTYSIWNLGLKEKIYSNKKSVWLAWAWWTFKMVKGNQIPFFFFFCLGMNIYVGFYTNIEGDCSLMTQFFCVLCCWTCSPKNTNFIGALNERMNLTLFLVAMCIYMVSGSSRHKSGATG